MPNVSTMTMTENAETTSIKCRTTDGTMYVFFIDDDNGKCQRVMIQLGKNGTMVRAWAESLMAIVNLALMNRVDLIDIANDLSNINSDRIMVTGEENSKIRSGPAGFVYAINKYIRSKNYTKRPPFDMPWF